MRNTGRPNTSRTQKLPYEIIDFVLSLSVGVEGKKAPVWIGNSDDVKKIRKMIAEVYAK